MLCRGPQRRAQGRRREGGTRDRGKGRRRSFERRREGGTRERGNGAKEVAREEERRRDEGTGEGAKEVARTAAGEAAGARVIGGVLWRNGCDGKVLRCGAGDRHQQSKGEPSKGRINLRLETTWAKTSELEHKKVFYR